METLSDARANWHGQTSEPLWRLSWSKLRSEQYCANITWKHFLVFLFTSFLPSLFDFGTDYLSGVNFLRGTNYTKYVNHGSDFGNCTQVVHRHGDQGRHVRGGDYLLRSTACTRCLPQKPQGSKSFLPSFSPAGFIKWSLSLLRGIKRM